MNAAASLLDHIRPIRRSEYDRMGEAGIFDGDRVELVRGVIVQMSPKGTLHDWIIERLTKILVEAIGDRASVRIQSAFAASDESEPEPDVALVPVARRRDDHPSRAFLLIEVADSSLAYDRTDKAALYAETGVPEYWIVNIRERVIEAHRAPAGGAYTHVAAYGAGASVAPEAFPDIAVAVDTIFGAE